MTDEHDVATGAGRAALRELCETGRLRNDTARTALPAALDALDEAERRIAELEAKIDTDQVRALGKIGELLGFLAARDATIARLREALRWIEGASEGHDFTDVAAQMGMVARAALPQEGTDGV